MRFSTYVTLTGRVSNVCYASQIIGHVGQKKAIHYRRSSRLAEISIHCFSDLPSFLCHVRGLGSTSSLLRRWRTFEGQMFALVGGLLHTCLRHVLPK